MLRSSLLIMTIGVVAILDCGGREMGTSLSGSASGTSSGTTGGASAGTIGGATAGSGSASVTSGSATTGDGPCRIVQASNYDQSCEVAANCVVVDPGFNSCAPGCHCGVATINAGAQAQYTADLAEASGPTGVPHCPCASYPTVPYCRNGTCDVKYSEPLDAAAVVLPDAGASGDAASATQPCNDGTGATDCCPSDAAPGGACVPEITCWTQCTFRTPGMGQGWRSSMACTSGQWIAGHGLFPCYRSDAGAVSVSDAAADTGPTMACPPVEPTPASPCDGPIDCRYSGSCGTVTWTCGASKSYWAVSQRPTCSGACPGSEPKQGDPCMAPGKCSYTSACGSQDIVFCDGTGTVMRIDVGVCPVCPAQEPVPFTPCSGSLSCPYTNACSGTDVANCMASAWTVLRGDCEK